MRSPYTAGAAMRGLCLLVLLLLPPATAEQVTLIDGKISEATVTAIEHDRMTLSSGTVPLNDIWRIERMTPSPAPSGMTERIVLDHGELRAECPTVNSGVCRFNWAAAADASLTRTVVRALILEAATNAAVDEAVTRALNRQSSADQVVVLGPDNMVLTLDGTVENVGASAIDMEYAGKNRTVSRGKVAAVLFRRPNRTPRRADPLPWRVTFADGTWLESDHVRLADAILTITTDGGALALPWTGVSRIEHRGRNIALLSALDPVSATNSAVMTVPLPWRRNRNAMNRPLRLQGRVRDTGLGTHAPSELVFAMPAGALRFLAVVGLDEEYGKRGDCVVTIRLDGREALRRRLRGTDEALPVDIDIGDARRLTLRAEPGENYDIADHVNWYDARVFSAVEGDTGLAASD